MTRAPLLSVCIPTFNRAGFLRQCLESIDVRGVEDLCEVVVSDNASTDGTRTVLEEFAGRLPLRWVIQDDNIGAERNFDAIVALARGEYCWLLGSDDTLEPGALSHVVSALQAAAVDLFHFGYVQADLSLSPLHPVRPPRGRLEPTPDGRAHYLARMPNVSMMFAFISTFVFRRELWMARRDRIQGWIGTHYVHLFAMHAALAEGATVCASDECLVVARGNNPNEFNTVPGKFVSLDARTLNRIVDEIHGGDTRLRAAFRRPFRRTYPPRALIHAAANGGLAHLAECRDELVALGHSRLLLDSLAALGRLDMLKLVKVALDLRRKALSAFSPKAP